MKGREREKSVNKREERQEREGDHLQNVISTLSVLQHSDWHSGWSRLEVIDDQRSYTGQLTSPKQTPTANSSWAVLVWCDTPVGVCWGSVKMTVLFSNILNPTAVCRMVGVCWTLLGQ